MTDHDDTKHEKELRELNAAIAAARDAGKSKPADEVFDRLEAKYAAQLR